MSERFRRVAGTILVLISILLCLVPALFPFSRTETKFRSGERQDRGIPGISTERNGNVQVNTAYAEELTELPGIGETLSSLIVAERMENGPFYYAEDLEAVKGIGSGTLERFRDMIDLAQGESGE